ncbi:MAG: ABC transporter substrate-binding protein [Silvanigrellaceae bacterium]|nr:ABC transporter substrate-binding protein [Silvanigrellaceae bacterium]
MKLNSAIVLIILVVALVTLISVKHLTNVKENLYTIGILQTASFPALDAARMGFINKINKELPGQVSFIIQNAQGSSHTAQSITASLKSNKNIDAFFAIASPALLALHASIFDKPIVFSAVTDPISLLGPRKEFPNITGSTDLINVKQQIKLITELLPSVRKIGIIYSPSEQNSTTIANLMKEHIINAGLDYEIVGVNSQTDVPAAVQKTVQNNQILLIPTDNTLAASLPLIAQITAKSNIPVIISWVDEENKSPLIQFGVDYYQSGEQAAMQILQILNEEVTPASIEYALPDNKIIVNKELFERYKLQILSNTPTSG